MVDLVQSAPLTINVVFFFSSASPTWHVALLPKGLSLEARTPIRFNSLKTVSCTVGWKILAFLLNTSNTETSCWFNVGSCPIRFKWMLITLMNWQLRKWRSHQRLQVKRPTGTTVLDPDCSKNVSTVCHDRFFVFERLWGGKKEESKKRKRIVILSLSFKYRVRVNNSNPMIKDWSLVPEPHQYHCIEVA